MYESSTSLYVAKRAPYAEHSAFASGYMYSLPGILNTCGFIKISGTGAFAASTLEVSTVISTSGLPLNIFFSFAIISTPKKYCNPFIITNNTKNAITITVSVLELEVDNVSLVGL